MERLIIVPGQIVAWLPDHPPCDTKEEASKIQMDLQRVLWSRDGIVIVFRISAGKDRFNIKSNLLFYEEESLVQTYKDHRWVLHDMDPFLPHYMAMSDEYKKNHQSEHDQAWSAIQDIVKEPAIYARADRGRLIRDASEAHGCTIPAIRKWLALYWMAGKNHEGLYPKFYECGSPGQPHQSKTSGDDRTKLEAGFLMFSSMGPAEAYQQTKEVYFSAGTRPIGGGPLIKTNAPSKGVFLYHGTKASANDLKSYLYKKIGSEEYQNSLKPRLGSMRQGVAGPGDRYQIDATIDDMYLVSQFDRRLPIGRPIYYTVVDVFSHSEVGFNLTLEKPQWKDGASLAVLCAILPKFEYYKQLGVVDALYDFLGIYLTEEMVPHQGIMTELVGDNEQNSKKAGAPLAALDVILTTTPPRRPWTKGLVEQGIDQWQEAYKDWVPGAVDERRAHIKSRHFALDAKLNMREFAQLIAIHYLMHNLMKILKGYRLDLDMREDRVLRFPNDIYNYGIENRLGSLRQRPREVIEWLLLPQGEATVRQDGLLFENKFYEPASPGFDDLFIKAALYGREKVCVSYHPNKMEQIALHIRSERKTIPFVFNNKKQDEAYSQMFKYDFMVESAIDKYEEKIYEPIDDQNKADFKHVMNQMVKKADEEQKFLEKVASPVTQKERLDIETHRKMEIEKGGVSVVKRKIFEEAPGVVTKQEVVPTITEPTPSYSQQAFSLALQKRKTRDEE